MSRLVLVFCLAVVVLVAQPPGGRGGRGAAAASGLKSVDITTAASFDPAAVARGGKVFAANCASCHGADARGGKGKTEIDLIRSAMVLDDVGGQEIGEFLKYGRPENNMPKFALSPADVSDLGAWIHREVTGAGERTGYKRLNVFSGDAKRGEAFFNGGVGKCNTCHSATGDMKGVAVRVGDDAPAVQGLILSGGGRGGGRGGRGGAAAPGTTPTAPPATSTRATVTLKSGEVIQGFPLTTTDFAISIRLANGTTRSWLRDGDWPKYSTTNPLQAHVDLVLKYTDDDIHNLAAYLETLK